MLLTAPAGSYVEADIVGYQFPTGDDNWLLVEIHVTTPQGSGNTVVPCWQAEEVQRMVVWFSAMAEGVPVEEWGGACLEANLEFQLVGASVESVTLRAHFILERGVRHPADGGSDVPDFGAHVDLEITRSDLRQVAQDLALELQQYPPREHEHLLPSPLL